MANSANSAGSLTVIGQPNTDSLVVGNATGSTGSTGSYVLTGGSLSTQTIVVGEAGSGNFTQSGASVTTNGYILLLGGTSNSSGTCTLGGTGSTLTTGQTILGASGSATFNQNAGNFFANTVDFNFEGNGSGTYNLNGGTLTTGQVGRDATGGVFQLQRGHSPGQLFDE